MKDIKYSWSAVDNGGDVSISKEKPEPKVITIQAPTDQIERRFFEPNDGVAYERVNRVFAKTTDEYKEVLAGYRTKEVEVVNNTRQKGNVIVPIVRKVIHRFGGRRVRDAKTGRFLIHLCQQSAFSKEEALIFGAYDLYFSETDAEIKQHILKVFSLTEDDINVFIISKSVKEDVPDFLDVPADNLQTDKKNKCNKCKKC